MNKQLFRAHAALAYGRLDEAEQLCTSRLKEWPGDLLTRTLLLRAKLSRWTASAAAAQLKAAVDQAPESVRSLRLLSVSCRRKGDLISAAEWAQRAADLSPEVLDAHLWCGSCWLEAENFSAAEASFRACVALKPKHAESLNFLGLALFRQGENAAAVRWFTEVSKMEPQVWIYRANLTEALLADSALAEAIESARCLIQLDPNQPNGHLLSAEAFIASNKPAEAEAAARRAKELAPEDASPLATLSSILMAKGEMEDAGNYARRSIELEPNQGLAYFNLVRSAKVLETDRTLLDQMEHLFSQALLPANQRVMLGFGLGKACEDLGEFETAMAWYDRANALDHRTKFGTNNADAELNRATYARIKRRYTPELLANAAKPAESGPTPIFVFGMMRSGTTLTEQILSSHPDVGGAGEQHFWVKNRAAAFDSDGALNWEKLTELRAEYLRVLAEIAPGKKFVVDKMPNNLMQVGLLHLAFPGAPMVHLSRHPIDTCLSIYVTHNRVAIPWANSKVGISRNYRRYLDLMAHWRKVLPSSRITDVQYETLVANPVPTIQGLLGSCGLEWSDACLHHEQNTKAVVTPSIWQVRQPIYNSSVERWRRFEPWLGALRELA